MARMTQVSVFLPNAPGELMRLCAELQAERINILAISIQNAKDYVEELFRARERSGRRIVLEESYRGVMREAADHSVIRLVVDQPESAERILRATGHTVDVEPVIGVVLSNRPAVLGEVASAFASAQLNIDYVYGSVMHQADRSLFVLHVRELERGLELCKPWSE